MRSRNEMLIVFLTMITTFIFMSEKINRSFCKIIKTGDKSIFDNLTTRLDGFYEGSTIVITSTLLDGKIEKKHGFYRSPAFLFPPELFINFEDATNDYEFVCIAIKKKKVIDNVNH